MVKRNYSSISRRVYRVTNYLNTLPGNNIQWSPGYRPRQSVISSKDKPLSKYLLVTNIHVWHIWIKSPVSGRPSPLNTCQHDPSQPSLYWTGSLALVSKQPLRSTLNVAFSGNIAPTKRGVPGFGDLVGRQAGTSPFSAANAVSPSSMSSPGALASNSQVSA